MKKLNINQFIFLCLNIFIVSCAGKPIHLKSHDYELGKYAKLNVHFIKQLDNSLEMDLLGISIDEQAIMIKKDEIQCGVDDELFSDVSIKGVSEDYIILPKTTFKEFKVFCKNKTSIKRGKTPYLIFKNLYNLKKNEPNKMIGSELRINFK